MRACVFMSAATGGGGSLSDNSPSILRARGQDVEQFMLPPWMMAASEHGPGGRPDSLTEVNDM